MSHMEQAYGFTPTHTEHNIISYPAYQIRYNVGKKESHKIHHVENRKNRCSVSTKRNCLLKPLGLWDKIIYTFINILYTQIMPTELVDVVNISSLLMHLFW